jgi:TMEM175 potassium channel family protein
MASNQDRHVDRATDFDETAVEDRGRFLAFSDGVFAFAATLLVVSLAAPALHPDQLSRLPGELMALWPQALAYAISFLVVTSYWGAHRQLFRQIPGLTAR